MTNERTNTGEPSLLHNWVSLAGMVLSGASFFAVSFLFALDFSRGSGNPYVGILTYIVAPAFLVAGLLLVAVGAAWERRRRRRAQPGEVPAMPRIDLNIRRQRRIFVAVSIVSAVFLLFTAVGSYRTYQFTESVSFCGTTCHTVMKPEYTAYQQSPHARVRCAQCHIGPGASWFVKSKLSGAYQVYATLTGSYDRPIPTPVQNLRPARETCEQCHWPRAFFGAAERTFEHYIPDAGNSPWIIRMLVDVGGGDPEFGAAGGIHWHMVVGNTLEYIAIDKARQVIPWVRVTDQHGNATVYQSVDGPLSAEQVAAAAPRTMDCIDCHNRPGHDYRTPAAAVDLALKTGRMDASLPLIKAQAVQALIGGYATTPEAMSGIADSLTTFYRTQYPGVVDAKPALLTSAIAETRRIYAQNFFPEMGVTWRVYPNNVGHKDFPGCFRCHDGAHASADGKVISNDCNVCHTIIAQGPPGAMETSLDGLKFQHPVDIPEGWEKVACSQCHAGELAG